MRGKSIHCKKCNAGPFQWAERFDNNSNRLRWVLIASDGAMHDCPVREVVEVACKYCSANDLWWSKEVMEDGSKKNVLMESYGLPHSCDERKKHFDALNQAKKDEYAKEKDRIEAIPNGSPCTVCGNGSSSGIHHVGSFYRVRHCICGGSGKVSAESKERMLWDVRLRIWPHIGRTVKK